ncbi:MAG: biopolymer transporter ExbD [Pseudomonadota bacterium]
MRRRRRGGGSDEAKVDMTPMLDVIFILLIFFIVTSTFLNEVGFDLTPPPPAPDNPNQQTVPAVQIYVDEASLIRVDGRPTDIGSVRANIERRKAEVPEISVVVQAHPSAKNRFVLQIIDQAKSANIDNVALVGSQE